MNCRVDEIVNLDIVRGSCYEKGQSFYEKLSVNYDALRSQDEHTKLDGFVKCTLNELP